MDLQTKFFRQYFTKSCKISIEVATEHGITEEWYSDERILSVKS